MKILISTVLYNESEFIYDTIKNMICGSKYDCDIIVSLSGNRFTDKKIQAANSLSTLCSNLKINHSSENPNTPSVYFNKHLHYGYIENDYDIVLSCSPDYRIVDSKNFDLFIDSAIPLLNEKYTISCVEFPNSNVRWSCVIVTKLGLSKVGYLDTNFLPMGRSDNDYHYRCLLKYSPNESLDYYSSEKNYLEAPYGKSIVVDCCHTAYNGSFSPGYDYAGNLFRSLTSDFLNESYYVNKWGGLPGGEKFTTPFNNGDANSIKIDSIDNFFTDKYYRTGTRNVCTMF